MRKYVLALDQGTSSSRAVLVDEDGAIVASEQREFPQIYPQAGWVEHAPEEIWSSQLATAQEVLRSANVSVDEVAGIGITNQRETAVVWDRATGAPIANAIVWQCRRTAEMCASLKTQGVEPLVRERTGLLIDAYFSATKVGWLLDHVPGARKKAEAGDLAFGTVDSWLIYKLTEGRVHATDATNASRTMLFSLAGAWDQDLLDVFGVPRSMMPDVVDSSGVFAESNPSLFGKTLPIAGIAGDQQAALFGQAAFNSGDAKNTYGTGSFLLMHTGDVAAEPKDLLATVASRIDGQLRYALEGSIFVTGAAVQWLRDGLGFIKDAADVEALATTVDSSDGVYLVPAFVGLGAPHWDAEARGTITGLTRGSTRGHIARATLEAIAYQTRDVVEVLEAESGTRLEALRADGGASRNDLLMQIQADMLGRPIIRSAQVETTALGAAYLAGLATGVWSGLDELLEKVASDRTFEPAISEDERETRYRGWLKAVERAKGWEHG
jgi:glycerol kinase